MTIEDEDYVEDYKGRLRRVNSLNKNLSGSHSPLPSLEAGPCVPSNSGSNTDFDSDSEPILHSSPSSNPLDFVHHLRDEKRRGSGGVRMTSAGPSQGLLSINPNSNWKAAN